jgi:hypothetical protein
VPGITPTRYVTVVDNDGVSRIGRNEALERSMIRGDKALEVAYPGWEQGVQNEIYVAWGGNLPFEQPADTSTVPSGDLPDADRPTGLRVSIVTYPPGWDGAFFWTKSTDFLFLMDGELTCVLDSGEEFTAKQGDIIVQQSTNKKWQNRTSEPATIGTVMCATVFDGTTPPADLQMGG